MSASHIMQGARLEYVARKINGTVTQHTIEWDKKQKKLVRKTKQVGDCYMVYLPTGHSYRLTAKQLIDNGFDRQPTILNFERVNDQKSPAGRFKYAINEEMKMKAWRELEDQVVKLCDRKHGKSERSIEEVEAYDTAGA